MDRGAWQSMGLQNSQTQLSNFKQQQQQISASSGSKRLEKT